MAPVPGKDRQQKYLAKHQAEGKKAVTVMISAKAHRHISDERKRTGETLSEVVDRIILNAFPPVR